eukprot:6107897-Amphidinium_carterae.1
MRRIACQFPDVPPYMRSGEFVKLWQLINRRIKLQPNSTKPDCLAWANAGCWGTPGGTWGLIAFASSLCC